MKKLLLLALCCAAGLIQAQAQTYLKQVVTFSLTGYLGPEMKAKKGTVITLRPTPFKYSDKDLIAAVASDKGLKFKSPQLVCISGMTGTNLGYYIMEGKTIVTNVSDYITLDRGIGVYFETNTMNAKSGLHSVIDKGYGLPTWSLGGNCNLTGLSTDTLKWTYSNDNFGDMAVNAWNYSAQVAGSYLTQDADSNVDSYAVLHGTITYTSTIVKNGIPGLPGQ